MPVVHLAAFHKYESDEFFIGGDPSSVGDVAIRWRNFGEAACQSADDFRLVNTAGFEGTEAEKYSQIVYDNFPRDLTTTGEAHQGVARALDEYGETLTTHLTRMTSLMAVALPTHTAHRAAVSAYNTAEANAIRARATAMAATATAAGTALVPGLNAVTASTAATAQAEASAAQAAFEAAKAKYHSVNNAWQGHLDSARSIKQSLISSVKFVVAKVESQTKKRFEENKNWLERRLEDIDNFLDKNAEWLKKLADGLANVGAIVAGIGLVLAFTPLAPLAPFLLIAGAAFGGASLGLDVALAASGNQGWIPVVIDAALTFIPAGRLLRPLKNTPLARHAGDLAQKFRGRMDDNSLLARGYDRVRQALEPVDLATGAMIHEHTDVHLGGVLPLVVDRAAFTSHEMGRAFGSQWVSRLDVRIEVTHDRVYMLTPTGALISFPSAPEDGSEVRGDGRGWLLSYGDGAYRVRDVSQGLTYVFAVVGTAETHAHPGPVEDTSPGVGSTYVGIPKGCIADDAELGIEIGISSVVHHTGHRIDYFYDQATGHMVSMVRSDGSHLEFTWDEAVDRVAGIWVSNPQTHPDDAPERLMLYEYDPWGRLCRVINSHEGVLRYHYNDGGLICGWTDRNGVSYHHVFDDYGRVIAQAGTGGVFANAVVYLPDTGEDAPVGGGVTVALETACTFPQDPLDIGDDVIPDILQRLQTLPLAQALREHGLESVGLTGRGRTGARDDQPWTINPELLYDEVLGDIRPTVYRSTAHGDVWRVITPEGTVVDTEFDANHVPVATTNTAGATTRYEYNEDGVLVSVFYPDETSTHVEPGSWGVPVRVVGRDGQITEYEVDAFGMTTGVTDPTGARSTLEYELRASGAVVAAATNPEGLTTQLECDDAGRQVAVVDPAGRRTSVIRDVRGLVIETLDADGNTTTIDYTPEGWPSAVTHPDGTTITTTYDGEGNQLSVTNEIGATTRTRYTVFDKPLAITDAAGSVTHLTYNTQMQPVALTNADGNTWKYEYNLDGMISREVDYNGIVTESVVSSDGLVGKVISPAGTTTTTWNALGRVETVVDASGTTVYSYDELGRISTISNPLTTVSYTRDDYGRITHEAVALASGESVVQELRRSPTGVVASDHLTLPGGDVFNTVYQRNEVGEITTSAISHTRNGREIATTVTDITYGRGSRGQRDRISVGSLVRSFDYDVRGRLIEDLTGALTLAAPTTGAKSSGAAFETPRGMRSVVGRKFSWRDDTTLTGIVDQLRGTTAFDVDIMGRVTGVRRDATGADMIARGTLSADSANGVSGSAVGGATTSSAGAPTATESYGFSPAGVLTSIAVPAPATTSGGMSFGVGDSQVELAGTMPTRVGRTTYTYDKAGRVTQTVTKRISKKPLVHRFYYAASRQPIGFESSDEPGVGYRYVYDGLDRRVAKERIDTSTGEIIGRVVFAHRGDRLAGQQVAVGQDRGAGYVWSFDPGTGEVIGQITLTPNAHAEAFDDRRTPPTIGFTSGSPCQGENTGTRDVNTGLNADLNTNGPDVSRDVCDWSQDEVDAEFFALVSDLAGAPHEIIDPVTGDVVGRSTQTLYGVRSWRGAQSSPLLFTGQYFDEESGWAYNRFRYYHPQAGVYNAQDPLGASPRLASAQGYVDHAGYWVDPLGLESCPRPGAGGDKDLVDPQTPKKSDAPEGKPHVPKPYNSGSDVVDHVTEKSMHGRPNRNGVFEVNSAEDVDEIWDTLRQGHEVTPVERSNSPGMDKFELEDGTRVQYRPDSKSGGQTIDIKLPEAKDFTVNDNGKAKSFQDLKVHVQTQK
ncbi:Putative deoxyribonuclease RhsC [Corynebacterium cystitidis DSM 20524]|uniref:DUF6531 domain-containing protein n=1 Tax=Corynebacterium cystitidis TaxID=35757 RepID=UPI000B94E00D|nr:DUF6531 domain-containing protein [Corynebacterium cystitidis]WJY81142.1 Putative deoxyribonuclease RhsC [Corynebacterium cystitidis DSM 20524]SNV89789.1 Uncharacterized conserved protein [Corynebacterium cystitidis]